MDLDDPKQGEIGDENPAVQPDVSPDSGAADVATEVVPKATARVISLEAVLRGRIKDFERMAYAAWMESLTPDERKSYDRLGFLFQLIHAVTQNREIIARAADERTAAKFSFTEVAELIRDLVREAESFLGSKYKDPDRKENDTEIRFENCYRKLVNLNRRVKVVYKVEEDTDRTTVTQFDADKDFLNIIKYDMPRNLAVMVILASKRDGDEPLKKTMEQKCFMIDLQVDEAEDEAEKEQILKAVEKAGKALKKIREGKAAGKKSKILLPDDLQAIVDELAKVEHVRRIYVLDPESVPIMNGQIYGIREIQRLIKFVRSWEPTFRHLGSSTIGKPFEDGKTEKKEEREERLEKEREVKHDLIKNFADAFDVVFESQRNTVAPLVATRHREVLHGRLNAFRLVSEAVQTIAVQTIEGKKLKKGLVEVLFQVSTILSYLDHMWNMHKVEKNSAGKHIVYPKKMILLAQFIFGDVEKLMGKLNYLSEELRALEPEPNPDDDVDIMFGEFADKPVADAVEENKEHPAGLGVDYGDSKTFRVGPDGIHDPDGVRSGTHDDAVKAAEPKPPEPKKGMSIADSLFGLAQIVTEAVRDAKAALGVTRIKKVMTNEDDPNEDDPNNADAPGETLSYEIHDFIHDLYDALSNVLYGTTKIFKPEVTRHDVLPQSAAYEEQAARLRGDVIDIGTNLTPATELMDEIFKHNAENRAAIVLPMLQAALGGVAADMAAFQAAQERNLGAQEYHAVLRGANFETMVRLANCSKNFKERYCEELSPNTIELYVLRKQIDEFVQKMSGGNPQGGIIGAWIGDVEYLKKVENRIIANNLKPQELEKLQERYIECFMHVLKVLDMIRKKEEVDHHCLDPKDPAIVKYPVSARVRLHFDGFAEANPMAERCVTEHFSPIYFKFFKLMHLMSDFKQVCNLRRALGTREQVFLSEYDMRKADVMNKENFEIWMTYSANPDPTPEEKQEIIVRLGKCREALSHLRFFDEERANDLDAVMAELERTLKSGRAITEEGLENRFLPFLRDYKHNPIVVKWA